MKFFFKCTVMALRKIVLFYYEDFLKSRRYSVCCVTSTAGLQLVFA